MVADLGRSEKIKLLSKPLRRLNQFRSQVAILVEYERASLVQFQFRCKSGEQ